MKILIIEDEITAAEGLKQIIYEYEPNSQVLECLDSISSSLAWFKNNPLPDLVFMDIQLADGLSFKIFDSFNIACPIIFCTAYDKYAIQAFKVNSIDYILKPIHKNDVENALLKYKNLKKNNPIDIQDIIHAIDLNKKEYKERFLTRIGKKLYFIPTTDIAYFYTEHKIVYIVTHEDRRYSVDHSLDDLCELVSDREFFRANRQFLISIKSLRSIESENNKLHVSLNSKLHKEIIVSSEKSRFFKAWLDL